MIEIRFLLLIYNYYVISTFDINGNESAFSNVVFSGDVLDINNYNMPNTFSLGKIYPNPTSELVLESLEKENIFCFGRFARWDPEELLHDTVKQINKWIEKL